MAINIIKYNIINKIKSECSVRVDFTLLTSLCIFNLIKT